MKFPESVMIDLARAVVTITRDGKSQTFPMASPEAFDAASQAWLRVGWDVKHVYSFTWLGRPMLQLPEDMIRLQEVIWQVQPDVIVETGVAHGGSLVFNASLCRALGKGRVIGVERGLYPQNKAALQSHALSDLITVIEGSSTDPAVVSLVKAAITPGETVMVVLDSNHSRDHVLAELEVYADLVTVGSYILACDGIMAALVGAPRSDADWGENNPISAIQEFLSRDSRFARFDPPFLFNESQIGRPPTYWPEAYLRRTR